ncbi:MAG: hypothetical protein KGQ54_01390 [Verrucomicrobia bacterium]|nr:hypothetical protein [Verrucomicrobiota bacterium]NDE63764.1 hypothetical protein [Chlamydiota bacterium]
MSLTSRIDYSRSFYQIPNPEPLDLRDYSPRPCSSSPFPPCLENPTPDTGYIHELIHSVKNSVSFYAITFHRHLRREFSQDRLLKWAYIMTKMVRLYHRWNLSELKKHIDTPAHLKRQQKLIEKIRPDAQLGRIINQDIAIALKEGFESLYKYHNSILHPFYDPNFTIRPVGLLRLGDSDKIEMKMHLKQLGLKKGKFANLLSIPAAGFQRIKIAPFCFEMALLLEDLFKEISLDQTKIRLIQITSDPVAYLRKDDYIVDLFQQFSSFSAMEKDLIVIHLASAITDWVNYVHNILIDGKYQIPKKIDDYDFKSLIEIFKFRQQDLRIERKSVHLKQLSLIKDIFEKTLPQELIGQVQILYLGESMPTQLNGLENWIATKGPIPDSFHSTCIEQIHLDIQSAADLTTKEKSTTLRMFFESIKDWDRFVYKVLSLPHLLEGAFKEKSVSLLC